jgi:hypothetical protein
MLSVFPRRVSAPILALIFSAIALGKMLSVFSRRVAGTDFRPNFFRHSARENAVRFFPRRCVYRAHGYEVRSRTP